MIRDVRVVIRKLRFEENMFCVRRSLVGELIFVWFDVINGSREPGMQVW